MTVFAIAAVTGVTQAFLLNLLIKNALSGNIKKTALYLFLKLLIYAATVTALVLSVKAYIINAALGYCLGLPGAALIFTAVKIIKNKERRIHEDENSRDN